jgi:pantoate--beta-alanine ligase
MITVASASALDDVLNEARQAERTVGFVPTMGALHGGHASLIKRARSANHVVVVSVFVNPRQFGDEADLIGYPRDLQSDETLAKENGADIVFAPSVSEMYAASFCTSVVVHGLSDPFEGRIRGVRHFEGVATVVVKLLNLVRPSVAYFGQKDAQQLLIVRQATDDLSIRVRIEACPTVREPDGLAMSSRNVLLDPHSRCRAVALSRGLAAAQRLADAGERRGRELLMETHRSLASFEVVPEYCELVSPDALVPVDLVEKPALLLVAARFGSVRLLDNAIIHPPEGGQ